MGKLQDIVDKYAGGAGGAATSTLSEAIALVAAARGPGPDAFRPGERRFAAQSDVVRADVWKLLGPRFIDTVSPTLLTNAILSAAACFEATNHQLLAQFGPPPSEPRFAGCDDWGSRLIMAALAMHKSDGFEPMADGFSIRCIAFVHGAMGSPGLYEFGGGESPVIFNGRNVTNRDFVVNQAAIRRYLASGVPIDSAAELDRLGASLDAIANPGPINPPDELRPVPFKMRRDGERFLLSFDAPCLGIQTPQGAELGPVAPGARATVELSLSEDELETFRGMTYVLEGRKDYEGGEALGDAIAELRNAALAFVEESKRCAQVMSTRDRVERAIDEIDRQEW